MTDFTKGTIATIIWTAIVYGLAVLFSGIVNPIDWHILGKLGLIVLEILGIAAIVDYFS